MAFVKSLEETNPILAENLLRTLLEKFPDFHHNSLFWNWFKALDDASFTLFMVEVQTQLSDVNGYVVEHNPIISYCIGAHNNVQLLGSVEHAIGAVFYVGPYMVKNKFPLLHSLTILDDCIKHIHAHPSKAIQGQ